MSDALTVAHKLFYEDTGMDRTRIQELVNHELHGSDEGELYLEREMIEVVGIDENVVTASSELNQGFGVRYTTGDKVAYRPGSVLDETSIRKAASAVRAIRGQAGGTIYTDKDGILVPAQTQSLYTSSNPHDDMTEVEKAVMVREINDYLRSKDPRVTEVSATLVTAYKCVEIVRPGHDPVADLRPMVRLNVSVVLSDAGKTESAYYGAGGRVSCRDVFNKRNWKKAADTALREANDKLRATSAPAGEMTVVLGNAWAGILLHEAIGHGLEGDFNRKLASAFSGKVGQRIAAPGVTVVDEGNIASRRGSLNVDDEGIPTQRNVLIEDGILMGYMQDRMNARLMGVAPTGNGRRESFKSMPLPRMTNTYALNGEYTQGEIFRSVKKGLYLPSFDNGQVDTASGTFNFNASLGYPIVNGRVQWSKPVSGAALISNSITAMMNIKMIGNDCKLDRGVGTCGKEGQGVPVGVGQPTLRIDNMLVGGR